MPRCLVHDRPGLGSHSRLGAAGRAFPAILALAALALVLGTTARAEKRSYGYDEDPVRLGDTALEERRLDDAGNLYREAIQSEWKLDKAHLGLGEVLRLKHKHAEAEAAYRTAIEERAGTRDGALYPEASAGLGLSLYYLGRPEEAKREFETALNQKGNLWNASYGMARLLIDEKKYQEAQSYLEKGKKMKGLAEGEDLYYFGLALAQVGLGDIAEAEKNSVLALYMNPEAEYGNLVGQIYTERNAPTLAIDAYERALATPGVVQTPEVHQNVALLYEGQRDWNDALRHYISAIELDSTFAPAFKNAARLYALGNQNERAGRFYLRYNQLVPDDPEGWYGQAEAFASLGSNKLALEAAEKAYSLNSEDPRVRLALARATYLTNDLERAERLYSSVSDTTMYKAADWIKLGQIVMGQKGFDRAEELLNRAIGMEPNNPEAYAAKGKLFLSRAKPDSAVVYYEKALSINPASLVAKINLGVALLQLRRPSDAIKVLREAVELNPNAVATHIYLGQALVMADDLSGALEEYQKALKLDPNSAPALRGAAFIHLKRKDYGTAETVLLKATALDPKNPDGWAALGNAQSGLNKIDAGIQSFEKALELSPNHEGALRGLEALKKAKSATKGQ